VAGSAPAFLNVSITLRSANTVVPGGVTGGLRSPIPRPLACTSETLTEPTNAVVRVVCATSQFVSIAPSPGKPFLGTHDGAFRYNLGTGATGNAHDHHDHRREHRDRIADLQRQRLDRAAGNAGKVLSGTAAVKLGGMKLFPTCAAWPRPPLCAVPPLSFC
jgi:hypothetical protein